MEVRLLGVHNLESPSTRLVSALVDGWLALDAGSLTSGLTFEEQGKIGAILLSHQHFDHFRDIATLGLAQAYSRSIPLYALPETLEAVGSFLEGDRFYPDFFRWPAEKPVFIPRPVTPGESLMVNGYRVVAHRVNHTVPSVGYLVTSPQGRSLFYTGDTGPGLRQCWEAISPDLLITEVTGPEKWREWLERSGHLTPALLGEELRELRRLKGYLPRVVLVHLSPMAEAEIAAEVEALYRELGSPVELGREGMRLEV